MVSHQNHMVIALLDSFDQALPFIHQSQWLFLHFSSIWVATSDPTSDGLSKTSESPVGRRRMSYQPLEDSGVGWAIKYISHPYEWAVNLASLQMCSSSVIRLANFLFDAGLPASSPLLSFLNAGHSSRKCCGVSLGWLHLLHLALPARFILCR